MAADKGESSAAKAVAEAAVAEAAAAEAAEAVVCTICLDEVAEENSPRTTVTLQCSHQFHLDCIGSYFNFKRRMECPNCRQINTGRWICSTSYVPNADENIWRTQAERFNITITPVTSIWDSPDEPMQFQPPSDSSTAAASPEVPPPNAPPPFVQRNDGVHIQADVVEEQRRRYPGVLRAVMTIQRVGASMNNAEMGGASIWATDDSIWAEPERPIPSQPGNMEETTEEEEAEAEAEAEPSFSPEADQQPPSQ